MFCPLSGAQHAGRGQAREVLDKSSVGGQRQQWRSDSVFTSLLMLVRKFGFILTPEDRKTPFYSNPSFMG